MWLLVAALVLLLLLFFLLRYDCDLTLTLLCRLGRSPTSALAGRVVWITGASSGIGEALALELASCGARLVLSARRTTELERVRRLCVATGVSPQHVLVLPLDVTQLDNHARAVRLVLDHFDGRLDVLVNNAGRSQRSYWLDTDIEVDRQLLLLNVLAPVSLTRAALPALLAAPGGGHVAVMSSTAGTFPVPCSAAYTGSKHALHGYFGALRAELASRGLRVTLLCPGPTFSQLLTSAFVSEPGRVYGGRMAPTDHRMKTQRCAQLCALAIANDVAEAWIALQPTLAFQYANHYAPWLVNATFKLFGTRLAMLMRDSKTSFSAESKSDKQEEGKQEAESKLDEKGEGVDSREERTKLE